MRFVTYVNDGAAQAGVVLGDRVASLTAVDGLAADLLAFIQAGPAALAQLRQAVEQGELPPGPSLAEVRLLAPLSQPPKNIMCLGQNYAGHAAESARATGGEMRRHDHPVVFTKAPTAINGPYDPIPYDPTLSTEIDWEVELAVVIGRAGRAIPVESALDHVFGYTIINDVTARDIQQRHRQYYLGKSLDGSCPMGPWIVTADEIPDPQSLRLTSHVNGVLKQEGHTSEQIFDVATTISVLSRGMTLLPGDIIATGTPEGVGFARTPPEYLRPGDEVVCTVEGIGQLRNRVVLL